MELCFLTLAAVTPRPNLCTDDWHALIKTSTALSICLHFKAQAHSSTTSAHGRIPTRCQHFRLDRVKTRRSGGRLACSASPPLFICLLSTTFSFFSSRLLPSSRLLTYITFQLHPSSAIVWAVNAERTVLRSRPLYSASRGFVSNSRPVPA